MADQQQGALVVDQLFLQEFQGFRIQIVGGLIEYQQVEGLGEQLGQQQTVALAAGQGFHRLANPGGVEQEILQIADHMLVLAIQVDHIGAFRHVVDHAFLFVQGVAQLVEIGHLQLGTLFYGAAVRSQAIQQQANQGGFTTAVRAQNAHPVAAHQGHGKIADNLFAAHRIADLVGFHHDLAGVVAALDGQAGGAGAAAALGKFVAHGFQGTHPAFIAGAACLDALANPFFFLTQFLVEFGIGSFFRIQRRLFATQVLFITAGPAGQLAAIQLDDAGGQ